MTLWISITQIHQNKYIVSGISQSITVEMVTSRFVIILPFCAVLHTFRIITHLQNRTTANCTLLGYPQSLLEAGIQACKQQLAEYELSNSSMEKHLNKNCFCQSNFQQREYFISAEKKKNL